MKHRPGLTLLEVLISIFIMAIGMLALLTLFPLGALSMAQALQNDRAASAANLAAEYAEAKDLRHDTGVTGAFTATVAGFPGLPNNRSGPSWPVFVDGFGSVAGPPRVGASPPTTPGIARVRPSYALTLPEVTRWFSLLDDLSFDPNATPAGGLVQRGGRYTWAYLLRRPRASVASVVDLTVVVYAGRDTQLGSGETTYSATGTKGANGLTLTYTAGNKPALRRNAWVLDVTYDTTNKVPQGNFYRVVNVTDLSATQLSLEMEGLLEADVNTVVVLDGAIEVFKKGTGWLP
jgi:prepilin-type N-terminal cleavage/methylation domain-containing protein